MENFHSRNEHNHADPEAWPDSALAQRDLELYEQVNAPYLNEERKKAIRREISLIALERWSRQAEADSALFDQVDHQDSE